MKFKSTIFIFITIAWMGCKKESSQNEPKDVEEKTTRLVGTWRLERSGYDINENATLDSDEVEKTPHKTRRIFKKDFKGQDYFIYDDTDAVYFAYDFTWSFVEDTTSFKFVRFNPSSGQRMDSFIHKIIALEDSELVLLQHKTSLQDREYFFEFRKE